MQHRKVLIVADLEGSSGCWSYRASAFMTREWAEACVQMTRDVNYVATALFSRGVRNITVKDFHRTGYNLVPRLLDPRVHLLSGFKSGPVPGFGDPPDASAVLFLGMHAASGTDGFLPHTLTSRIARLDLNGSPLPEVLLFAASLAPHHIQPVFFSGCPEACRQARAAVPGIQTLTIDKNGSPRPIHVEKWRRSLGRAAVSALEKPAPAPFCFEGRCRAVVTMRDGPAAARKLARRWQLQRTGDRLWLHADNIHRLYKELIRICYLTPMVEKYVRLGLPLFNLRGRIGLWLALQRRERYGSNRRYGSNQR